MKNKIINLHLENNSESLKQLIKLIKEKKIVYIQNNLNYAERIKKQINYEGPAIILNSSGSKNKPKKCLHKISNLNQSAKISGEWLMEQGFVLKECIIFNSLPVHHISGMMAFWRSKVWDCELINISPELMKEADYLLEKTISKKKNKNKYFITSLVPTQIFKLLSKKKGVQWMQLFDLIWVGGAAINDEISKKCIEHKINLSPCYGMTETSAMISSLKPSEFLKGFKNSGEILKDTNIKINEKGIIEIKTKRTGIELLNSYKLKNFKNNNGWFKSGDLGKIIMINDTKYLEVIGRSDNAFISGGETVFPDVIYLKIEKFIMKEEIPIFNFKISIIQDKEWGERFEIILNFKKNISKKTIMDSMKKLDEFSSKWKRSERPLRWITNSTIQINSSKFILEKTKSWKDLL
tara:strand:+ start:6051 stop:7274 length:1224 start_codon:yes stop_codon:yes gene_type:complete